MRKETINGYTVVSELSLDEYQQEVKRTFDNIDNKELFTYNFLKAAVGMAGESSAELLPLSQIARFNRPKITDEMGDWCFYTVNMLSLLDMKLIDVYANSMALGTEKYNNLNNVFVNLANYSGIILEHAKKVFFHNHPVNPSLVLEQVQKSVQCLIIICTIGNVPLHEIFDFNVTKLYKRYAKGYSDEASINREEYVTKKS